MATKSYHDTTYNSSNPLRRYAHRTRFKKSVKYIDLTTDSKVMDFGCGDGLFLNQLYNSAENSKLKLVGFEPYMKSLSTNKVEIIQEWNDVLSYVKTNGKFNYVTAFEVLEHFTPERQIEALNKMYDVLSDDGELIISVPIEKGFPSVVKNILRRVTETKKSGVYSTKNIAKSFLGRPIPEHREGKKYLYHMGFYYTDLEGLFTSKFVVAEKEYSPFNKVGYNFNSQVFYKLTRRN